MENSVMLVLSSGARVGLRWRRWGVRASDPSAFKGCVVFLLTLWELWRCVTDEWARKMEDRRVRAWRVVRKAEDRVVVNATSKGGAVVSLLALLRLVLWKGPSLHSFQCSELSVSEEAASCWRELRLHLLWTEWAEQTQNLVLMACMILVGMGIWHLALWMWRCVQHYYWTALFRNYHLKISVHNSASEEFCIQVNYCCLPGHYSLLIYLFQVKLKMCHLFWNYLSSSSGTCCKSVREIVAGIASSAQDLLRLCSSKTRQRLGSEAVNVNQMLLMLAGDVERNPGPDCLTIDDLQAVLEALVDVTVVWYELGLALGLKAHTLDAIKEDERNVRGCKRQMLSKWLRQVDGCRPNWRALMQALRKDTVEHRNIADRIAQLKVADEEDEGDEGMPNGIRSDERKENSSTKKANTEERENDHQHLGIASPMSRYAYYLRSIYRTAPLAKRDKLPQYQGQKYFKLALIKKEKLTQELSNHFTCLTLQGHNDQIWQAKEPIEMDQILRDCKTRVVVVEGAPGIGKSTFAWEMCRMWETLASLERFTLVVLLRLREEGVQKASAISDLFYHYDAELRTHVEREIILNEGDGVLLILDGFDELPSPLRSQSLVAEMVSGSCLPRATVVVTSRPSATADLLSACQTSVDKRIEIVGFTELEIQEYAKTVFGCGSEILASFQAYLSVNPAVSGMMYNPLRCEMVVDMYRYTYHSHRPIPHTRTQLYTELSLSLVSRYLSETQDPLARRLPNRLEDIPRESNLYQQLFDLGRLAFEGREREEVIFKKLPEGCSSLGLLNTCHELYGRRETETFNFLHLSLQEYLGAFYISQLPASEQRRLFMEYCRHRQLNVVWQFVAGLTRMQDIGWENICKGLGSKFNMTPCVLQCLYEAQDAQSCEMVLGQSHVNYQGYSSSSLFVYFCVGYCLSKSRSVWDVSLNRCVLVPEALRMLGCGIRSGGGGGGYVRRLWLSKRLITIEALEYFQQLPHHILRQITFLGLETCGLGQREFEILADTLPLMSSLQSLDLANNEGNKGCLVKLLKALTMNQRIQYLNIFGVDIGMEDVIALHDVVHKSETLDTLLISSYDKWTVETWVQLTKTILTPSSLKELYVRIPSIVSPLDYIESISDNVTLLIIWSDVALSLDKRPAEIKGGIKLSDIIKKNSTLQKLQTILPLEKEEVSAIIASLKHNNTIKELWLSKSYHMQYFSELERQALDRRVRWI